MGNPDHLKMAGQGIQQLMDVEKVAAEEVQRARKNKVQRMKEAKREAELEIAMEKEKLEKSFQEFAAANVGGNASELKSLEQSTESELRNIESQVNAQKAGVIKTLLGYITTVDI